MLIVHNRFTFNCALNKQKPVTRTLHIRYILIFLIAPLTRSPYPVASNCLPRLLSQSFLATIKNAFPLENGSSASFVSAFEVLVMKGHTNHH